MRAGLCAHAYACAQAKDECPWPHQDRQLTLHAHTGIHTEIRNSQHSTTHAHARTQNRMQTKKFFGGRRLAQLLAGQAQLRNFSLQQRREQSGARTRVVTWGVMRQAPPKSAADARRGSEYRQEGAGRTLGMTRMCVGATGAMSRNARHFSSVSDMAQTRQRVL